MCNVESFSGEIIDVFFTILIINISIFQDYHTCCSVLTVGIKFVTLLSYAEEINLDLSCKLVTIGWNSFSANPDIDLFVVLGKVLCFYYSLA